MSTLSKSGENAEPEDNDSLVSSGGNCQPLEARTTNQRLIETEA